MSKYVCLFWLCLLTACGGTTVPDKNPPPQNNGGDKPVTNPTPPGNNTPGTTPPGNNTPGKIIAKNCDTLIDARIWRLTPIQIDNTIQSLLPGAPEISKRLQETLPTGKIAQSAAREDLTQAHFEVLLKQLDRVAIFASENPTLIDSCAQSSDEALSATCLNSILENFAGQLFRKPLSDSQISDYKTFYQDEVESTNPQIALQTLIQVLLAAPDFQFRKEIPGGNNNLDAWAIAENLSYSITDSPPDEQLRQAAANGSLSDSVIATKHTQRLLSNYESAAGFRRFVEQWLSFDKLAKVDLDPEIHEGFTPDILDEFAEETTRFVAEVFNNNGKLDDLWNSSWSIVNPRLANWYGIDHSGSGWQKVDLSNTPRRGLLGQGSVLLQNNDMDYPSIILRGHHMLEHFFCWEPAVPDDVPAFGAEPSGQLTQRQRLEGLLASSDQGCSHCHTYFNPLGYAMDLFDAGGRQRELDNGLAIDPAATWNLGWSVGDSVMINGPEDLASELGKQSRAQSCFVNHLTDHFMGYAEKEQTACANNQALMSLVNEQASLAEVLTSLITSKQFMQRGAN